MAAAAVVAVDFVHVAAGVVVYAAGDAAAVVGDAVDAAAVFVVAGRAMLGRVMRRLPAFQFVAGSRQRQSRQRLDSKHKTKSR